MEQLNNEERYGQARNADRMYGDAGEEDRSYQYEGGIDPSPELKGPYQGLSSFTTNLVVGENLKTSTESILDPHEQMARLLEMKITATLEGDKERETQLQKMIALHGEKHNIPYNDR
jgi:hypothetical protein